MKKFMAVVGLMAGLVVLGGQVWANTSVVISVTPTGTKGLTATTPIDFGAQNLGASGQNIIGSTVCTVTSTGTIVQSYAMHILSTSGWTAAAASTADTFHLQSVFKTLIPVVGDFNANDDLLSGAFVLSTTGVASVYAKDGGPAAESGVAVSPGAVRNLWFKLDMPTTSGSAAVQTITVELQAQ